MSDHVQRYLGKLNQKRGCKGYKRIHSKKNIGKRTGDTIVGVAGLEDISVLFSGSSPGSSPSSSNDPSTSQPVTSSQALEPPPDYHENDTDDEEKNVDSSQAAEVVSESQHVMENLCATTFMDQGTQCDDLSPAQTSLVATELQSEHAGRDKEISVKKRRNRRNTSSSDNASKPSTPRVEESILSKYTEMITSGKASGIIKKGTMEGSLTKETLPTPKKSQQSVLCRRLTFNPSSQEKAAPKPTVSLSQTNFPNPSFELDSFSDDQDDVIVEPNDPQAKEKVGLAFVPTPTTSNLSLLKRRSSSHKLQQPSRKEALSLSSKKHQKGAEKSKTIDSPDQKENKETSSKSRQRLFVSTGSASRSQGKQSVPRSKPKSRKTLSFSRNLPSQPTTSRKKDVPYLVEYPVSSDESSGDEDYHPQAQARRKSQRRSSRSRNHSHSRTADEADSRVASTGKKATSRRTSDRGSTSGRNGAGSQRKLSKSDNENNRLSQKHDSDGLRSSKKGTALRNASSEADRTLTRNSSQEDTLVDDNFILQSIDENQENGSMRKPRRRSTFFKSLAEKDLAMDFSGCVKVSNISGRLIKDNSVSEVVVKQRSEGKPKSVTKFKRILSYIDDEDTDNREDDKKSRHSARKKIAPKKLKNQREDDELRKHIQTFYMQSSSDSESESEIAIKNVSIGKRRLPPTRKQLEAHHADKVNSKINDISATRKDANVKQKLEKSNKKRTKQTARPAPDSLRTWLDSQHDEPPRINLTPRREESGVKDRRSTVNRKKRSERKNVPSEEEAESGFDHPLLPSVNESAISHSVGNKSPYKFGPPSSTPRRTVQKLSRMNIEKHDMLQDSITLMKPPLQVVRTRKIKPPSDVPTDHVTEILNSDTEDSRQFCDDQLGNSQPESDISISSLITEEKKPNKRSIAGGKRQKPRRGEVGTRPQKSTEVQFGVDSSKPYQSHSSTTPSNARKRHMGVATNAVSPPKGLRMDFSGRTSERKSGSKAKLTKGKGKKSISIHGGTNVRGRPKKKSVLHVQNRKLLEFLHEKELDIMIPEQRSTALRRSKRVRMSRRLGFGEYLVYSEPDKNKERHLIGIQTRAGLVPIDASRDQGELIHFKPPVSERKVKRRQTVPDNKAPVKTKNRKGNTSVRKTGNNVSQRGEANPRNENGRTEGQLNYEGDRTGTSWFDEMGAETSDASQNQTNAAERTIKLVDADTNSYIVTELSSVLADQFGTDKSLKGFSGQQGVWISKGIRTNAAAQGKIIIRPRMTKSERLVQSSDMFFSVVKGILVVKMGGQTLKLNAGAYFAVKSRNHYSLYNPSNSQSAELVYCMIRTK